MQMKTALTFHHTPIRMAKVSECVRKQASSLDSTSGHESCCNPYKNRYGDDYTTHPKNYSTPADTCTVMLFAKPLTIAKI